MNVRKLKFEDRDITLLCIPSKIPNLKRNSTVTQRWVNGKILIDGKEVDAYREEPRGPRVFFKHPRDNRWYAIASRPSYLTPTSLKYFIPLTDNKIYSFVTVQENMNEKVMEEQNRDTVGLQQILF